MTAFGNLLLVLVGLLILMGLFLPGFMISFGIRCNFGTSVVKMADTNNGTEVRILHLLPLIVNILKCYCNKDFKMMTLLLILDTRV